MPQRLPTRSDKRLRSDEHWIPLSDLMTGLMMVFMLIAIVFMVKVQAETKTTKALKERAEQQTAKMREIALIYSDLREKLYNDLRAEFRKDLREWGAELDRDLSIRFKEPEVLFASGKSELSSRFKEILSDFFPRYLRILSGRTYHESIEEIRIEGHTSRTWIVATSPENAYMLNMALSQERTRSVLQYVLFVPRDSDLQGWLIGRLTANGLSSSKLRSNPDGSENRDGSRRVEFRIRTNADKRLTDVLKAAQ
jgi:outer membrane protein OmpA-like peptidoglycan-associated protein